MRKTLLILFCAIILMKANAQVVFCPPGAEWHYNFYDPRPITTIPYYINEAITYSQDSILGVDTLKVLSHHRFFNSCNFYSIGKTLIKQKGDTIFIRNQCTKNQWQILYNYAAQPGQGWQDSLVPASSPSTATYTIIVDSVKYITVDGFNLKHLFVTYNYSYKTILSSYKAVIAERLGCMGFLFNFYSKAFTDGDYFTDYLCYQDSVFGVKQFTSKPCDYTTVGLEESAHSTVKIIIFPNPASEILNINFRNKGSGNYQTRLINLLGETVLAETRNQEQEIQLNIRELKNGIYYLQVFDKGKLIDTEKIIKE